MKSRKAGAHGGLVAFLFVISHFTFLQQGTSQSLQPLPRARVTYQGITLERQTVGLVSAPDSFSQGKIVYQFALQRPDVVKRGHWPASHATLELNGARFNPKVYWNGQKVAELEGGMAPLQCSFALGRHRGADSLGIELQSLHDFKNDNASYIPTADQWRSNISSCMWDQASIRFHGPVWVHSAILHPHFDQRLVKIAVIKKGVSENRIGYNISLSGRVVKSTRISGMQADTLIIKLPAEIKPWTPEQPNIYPLKIELSEGERVSDTYRLSFGLKKFEVRDKQFYLNNHPYHLRGATVVWHRWVRDKEGRQVAWDTAWFIKNVIKPLKARGANFLRFHLGLPPTELLNLCDKYGLAVQQEWSFFHGIEASQASMRSQYAAWLQVANHHPSVCLLQPWNETDESVGKTNAWAALNAILPAYPHLVLAERDVIHVHKYWYSMFENLGLYYDTYTDFPKAVMADEFGGNYLDGYGNPGGYKTLKETFQRFLGKRHTADQRLEHHTLANARVAEYWRRLGVGGFTPFCLAGSWDDGNHW